MTILKVGSKGQITLLKKLREKYGIKPGSFVEEIEANEGILIKAVGSQLETWRNLANKVSKKWPSGISSVQAIREDRTK